MFSRLCFLTFALLNVSMSAYANVPTGLYSSKSPSYTIKCVRGNDLTTPINCDNNGIQYFQVNTTYTEKEGATSPSYNGVLHLKADDQTHKGRTSLTHKAHDGEYFGYVLKTQISIHINRGNDPKDIVMPTYNAENMSQVNAYNTIYFVNNSGTLCAFFEYGGVHCED